MQLICWIPKSMLVVDWTVAPAPGPHPKICCSSRPWSPRIRPYLEIVFCRCNWFRWGCAGVGRTAVLIRRHTGRQRLSDAFTSQETLRMPAAPGAKGRARNRVSSRDFRESTAQLPHWFQTFSLQNCKTINFCCFSQLVCGTLLQQS